MAAPLYKLHYFHGRARAELIRYILEYANVPYEDVVVKMEDWPKVKPSLMSDDPFENAWGDQLAGAIEDMYNPYHMPLVIAKFMVKDDKKLAQALENMKTQGEIPLFQKLEKFLGDKKWFCGNKVHWVDLFIGEYVNRMESILKKWKIEQEFPNLYAHMKRVHELAGIKKYITEKRPTDRMLLFLPPN